MVYPTWQAGTRVTAAKLQGMQWQAVTQGSNQTVNNSTTFVDSSIVIPVEASATYLIMVNAPYTTGTTPRIKFEWTGPTGIAMLKYVIGPALTSTGGPSATTLGKFQHLSGAGTDSSVGGGTLNLYYEWSTVTTDVTAGDMTLRFAQNTADASNTTLQSAARADYLRIG